MLTDKQIERFYDTLIKILERKFDVKIDYEIVDVERGDEWWKKF